MKKRVLALLLALILTATCFIGTAGAAMHSELETFSGKYYTLPDPKFPSSNVTYYNVTSSNFETSTRGFLYDMLTGNPTQADLSVYEGYTQASMWQRLGYWIQRENSVRSTSENVNEDFASALSYSLLDGIKSYDWWSWFYAEGAQYPDETFKGHDSYDVLSSGLNYAGSIAEAGSAIEDSIFLNYKGAGGGRDDKYKDSDPGGGAVYKNETLSGDTTADDVFWIVNGMYHRGSPGGHYRALAVVFHDFKVTPILPEDSNTIFATTVESTGAGGNVTASHVKNLTDQPVTASQTLSTSVTAEHSSEINGSKAYSYQQGITVGVEKEFAVAKASLEISLGWEQTVSSGWSNSESQSKSVSSEYSVEVTLPEYTNVMLKQEDSESVETTIYNCPVAVSFSVTIVDYMLDPASSGAKATTQVLATYHGDARSELRQRWDVERGQYDGLTAAYTKAGDHNLSMHYLQGTAAMSGVGAKYTVKTNTVESSVYGYQAYYPLTQVVVTDESEKEYDLDVGDSLYVDTIDIAGQNDLNGAYYGFRADEGSWVLVDEDGAPLTDTSIAELVENPLTGRVKLVANGGGTAYLKYEIDEDAGYSSVQSKVIRSNDPGSPGYVKPAYAQINITPPDPIADVKSIDITGALVGYAGDAPVPISDYLTAAVRNKYGQQIRYAVTWVTKDLNGNSITIDDNQISFSKDGIYEIAAVAGGEKAGDGIVIGGVWSGWYKVSANPARSLSALEIDGSISAVDITGGAVNVDLSLLGVNAFDQYGDAWTKAYEPVWYNADGDAPLTEEKLLVDADGTYEVYAAVGSVKTVALTITAFEITGVKISPESTSVTKGSTASFTAGVTGEGAVPPEIVWTLTGSSNPDTKLTGGTLSVAKDENAASLTIKAACATHPDIYAEAKVTVSSDTGGVTGPTGPVNPGGGNTQIDDEENPLSDAIAFDAFIKGFEDGTFRGTVEITREEFVTILYRLKTGANAPLADAGTPSFKDVAPTHWSYDEVEWALAEKIISPDADGNFRPRAALTRSEMAVMLVLAESFTVAAENTFTDLAGHPDRDAILKAVKAGIFKGYPDGSFRPDGATQRSEAVTALIRYLLGGEPTDDILEGLTESFSDVSSTDWAYKYILLAVNGYTNL